MSDERPALPLNPRLRRTASLCCPSCKARLRDTDQELHCARCARRFPVIEGLPDFVEPGDELKPNDTIWAHDDAAAARDLQYDRGLDAMRGAMFALDLILDAMPADGRMLDVGTGTGHFAQRIASAKPRAEVLAFDLAWQILQPAQRRLAAYENVVVFRANARRPLAVAPASFDVVLVRLAPLGASDVPVAAAAADLLRPGGVFVDAGGGHDWTLSDPLEWCASFGYEDVQFHTWRYERVLSAEEIAARMTESARIAEARRTTPHSFESVGEQAVPQVEHVLAARLPFRAEQP